MSQIPNASSCEPDEEDAEEDKSGPSQRNPTFFLPGGSMSESRQSSRYSLDSVSKGTKKAVSGSFEGPRLAVRKISRVLGRPEIHALGEQCDQELMLTVDEVGFDDDEEDDDTITLSSSPQISVPSMTLTTAAEDIYRTPSKQSTQRPHPRYRSSRSETSANHMASHVLGPEITIHDSSSPDISLNSIGPTSKIHETGVGYLFPYNDSQPASLPALSAKHHDGTSGHLPNKDNVPSFLQIPVQMPSRRRHSWICR